MEQDPGQVPQGGWLGHRSGERAAERGLGLEWTHCVQSEVTDTDQDTHCERARAHTHTVLIHEIALEGSPGPRSWRHSSYWGGK